MHPFECRISAALKETQAESGSTVRRPLVYLAAVSGGADSTAMLAALAALRGEEGFALHCVHVEHGIRDPDESQGDALAVKELCLKLGVPCRFISIPPGKVASYAYNGGPGIEGAARFFRFKALRRERRRLKADWILTAHTQDDLVETVLMRVLRGSGPAGLAPMPRSRGRLLRPLLDLRRQDVLEYLEEKKIPYRTDSTNTDITFLRNRVRLKLIPVLDSFFPSWRNSLLSLAETQALTAEFLAIEARKLLPWKRVLVEGESRTEKLLVKEEVFFNAHLILREEAIFAGTDLLARYGGGSNRTKGDRTEGSDWGSAMPRRAAVRRAASQEMGAQSAAQDLGPLRLEKQDGYISMSLAPKKAEERGFSLLIKEPGFYTLKGRVLGPGKPDLFVRAFKSPLVFRNQRNGDCIFRGGRKRRFSDILDRVGRSRYTEIITVYDVYGPAAFIGVGGDLIVISRDLDTCGVGSPLFEISLETMVPGNNAS